MAEKIGFEKIEDFEDEGILQLVGFEIANEQFGVNILLVQEIIRSAKVTAVPNSPMFVEGVINLRGNIIPVIDLRKRLYLYEEGADTEGNWVLILNIEEYVVGFIVDNVTKVLKIAEDSVEPPPEVLIAGLESQYIQGVCDIAGALFVILDFNRVLFNEEYRMLKDIDQDADELLLDDGMMV
ncbi:Positive regulator of CheA protein activity (CheW) [hydrothermal vent metagenome]|uniref:Positive regulator of CheA protein activity (CheW) n=1 Tax=hydrothermal vent metagenome TaxID=652676 RepID=A0A3B1B9P8_9ZZZZ